MKNADYKLRKKKKKVAPQELQVLKEQQKLLYLRQRRKIRKRQMMLQRIRSILKFGSTLGIFLALLYVILIPQWKLSPFIFDNYPNNNLSIENNLITKDSQILEALKKVKIPDKPLFMVNPDYFEKALLKLDPVKKVYVRRYWLPARLNFVIIEKVPVFLVQQSLNAFPAYAVTADGTTIGKRFLPLPQEDEKGLFRIVLPNTTVKWNKDLVEKYSTLVNIIEKATNEKISYVDLTNPKDIYVRMSGFSIRIGEIDATIMERISRLKTIMPKIKDLTAKTDYIDLRWDKAISLKEKVTPEQLAAQAAAKAKEKAAEEAKNPKDKEKPSMMTMSLDNMATQDSTSTATTTTADTQKPKPANTPQTGNNKPASTASTTVTNATAPKTTSTTGQR